MKRYWPVIVVCGLVVGLVSVGKSQGPAVNKPRPPTSSGASPVGWNSSFPSDQNGLDHGDFQHHGEFQPDEIERARIQVKRLVNELRNEEDAGKKKELVTQLEESVTKIFDEDLSTRDAELKQVEERLKKLRSQLDKRRQARSEIIQLQLKILSNEAEGLGFSGGSLIESSSPSSMGMGFYPGAPGKMGSPARK